MSDHAMNRREFGALAAGGLAGRLASLTASDTSGQGSPNVTVDEPARKTPVIADVDVVVAGGGPAGFVAAIAAARMGARTLLLERYGFLGGGLTAGGVLNIRPFHVAPGKVLMDGIPLEYVRRLEKLGATRFIPGDYIPVQQDREFSKFVIQEMVLEAGVQLLLHSPLVGAIRDKDQVTAVLVENKSGRQAIRAKVFVDCTGDADLTWHAGAPWVKGDAEGNLQPMTLAFALSHVVRPADAAMTSEEKQAIKGAYTSGGFVPMIAPDEVYANAMEVHADCTDAQDLTRAEIEGRREVMRILDVLRQRLPGYRNARLRYTATHIGPRESRRIVGDYTLRAEDVFGFAQFDDTVCRGHHPVDVHGKDGVYKPLPPGASYAIPARCLMAQGVGNLLAAGRCISADRTALGSSRVTGTCMALGQAAGTIATLAAKRRCAVREVPFVE
ncbi:FAD-dependent oxidoreductase, partial [Candidatus Sumerlaeota bacterium]|nr:FAD-dependent oxidoreductase [Candidatus Sumerlaeota bacterium]